VHNEDYNIKITTRTDLLIADQIMAQAESPVRQTPSAKRQCRCAHPQRRP
jgi:hypothetical protein